MLQLQHMRSAVDFYLSKDMTDSDDLIFAWLDNISGSVPTSKSLPSNLKRKRDDDCHRRRQAPFDKELRPTPDSTMASEQGDDVFMPDPDQTPRSNRLILSPVSRRLRQSRTRGSTSTSSTSTRSQSSSPIKKPDDLLVFQKPVQFHDADGPELMDVLESRSEERALGLIRNIRTQTISGFGYLPLEIKTIICTELKLDDMQNFVFAPDPRQEYIKETGHKFLRLFQETSSGSTEAGAGAALLMEYQQLRDIVTASKDFNKGTYSEAAWNEGVHYPLLRLATKGYRKVGARYFHQLDHFANFSTERLVCRTLLSPLSPRTGCRHRRIPMHYLYL